MCFVVIGFVVFCFVVSVGFVGYCVGGGVNF
jgi:hypothetical protein